MSRPVEALCSSLDPAEGPIQRAETHVSTLVFQGMWAYKVKKAVHFEFVDLSTPELRLEVCRREVALNRRFADDVYDGVVEIRDDDGSLLDHAVKMRRMPAPRRLSTLVSADDGTDVEGIDDALRSVARQMAVAHAEAPRRPAIDSVATPEALSVLWKRSITDMRAYAPSVFELDQLADAVFKLGDLADVEARSQRYVDGRGDLFTERIRSGCIVDGHGDLLADDIFCLDNGAKILDCLEFDDLLRYGDVLLDIGFLAMDLERLDRTDLAARFVALYDEYSNEHHPASLLHHYVAYRALIRAKVAAIRAIEAPTGIGEARRLLRECRRHLRAGEVVLVIVGGLPGSGKTTVATSIAAARGWLTIEADATRKELAGVGPNPAPAAFGAGIYDAEHTDATYHSLMQRAEVALRRGESVVLDASFSDGHWRSAAESVAAATHSLFVAIRCVAPSHVRESRIRLRGHDAQHLSDATSEISARMAEHETPWSGATTLDTTATEEDSARNASAEVDSAIGSERSFRGYGAKHVQP